MQKFFDVNRRDVTILLAILVVGGALLAYSRGDVRLKRVQLKELAAGHEREMFDGLSRSDHEVIVEVASDKSNYFFGKDWGVVRLYIRKKGDTKMDSFNGVEYFYEYGDAGWKYTDSARIVVPQEIYDGYRKFEEAGHVVDSQAYMRYNR